MDVWTYFEQRERECRDLSVAPEGAFAEMCAELEGSGAMRGRFFGRLILTDRAFLQVSEVVVVRPGHVHREEYAYYLIIDGVEIWGEERDPTHDPAVHRHTEGHRGQPSDGVTFRQAVESAWNDVTEQEAYTPE